ncbi:S-layer homology domain-containing protein [Anaerovorax sp. IOR16]|uniref:S-layer homology domain-containing protein n=1 Tax=Anaerovorax sp. IOR16 TaxID=2773458 RepID=UPI0019D171BA|nr:S-layer homology domain-containing protein [Anaerovorax sp. IOR16]
MKTRKRFRRVTAFILMLMLIMTSIPGITFAAEEVLTDPAAEVISVEEETEEESNQQNLEAPTGELAETVEVLVTISVEGEFKLGCDGATGLICVPMEVEKGSTVADVLQKAHELYHEDGLSACEYNGTSFSKFWGQNTYNIGYFNNGMMVMDTTAEVKDGDQIEGTIYKDFLTDLYTRFCETEMNVKEDQMFSVTLKHNVITTSDWKGGMMSGASADIPLEDATILIGNETSHNIPSDNSKGIVTDKNGQAVLSFEKAGTYYLSALKEGEILIPSNCKVIVEEGLSDDEKQQCVAADKEALTFDGIKGGNEALNQIKEPLNLIQTGQSGETFIRWSCSDSSVILKDGSVKRSFTEDKTVQLTATVSYGEYFEEKVFSVTIKAYSEQEIQDTLNAVITNLPDSIEVVEWNGEVKQDTNIIDFIEEKVRKQNLDIQVAGTCDPLLQTQIQEDGTIVYGEEAIENQEVSFTLSLGDTQKEYKIPVTVPKRAVTKQEVLSGNWLTFDLWKGKNLSQNEIKTMIYLPKEDPLNCYTETTWESSHPAVTKIEKYAVNGAYETTIYRPAVGEKDVSVTLTAIIKPSPSWDYGMAPKGPMPVPSETKKTFQIVIPAVTEEEEQQADDLLNEAIQLFSMDDITVRGTKEKADLNNLTYSINDIPYNWNYVDEDENFKEAYREIQVMWTSENLGVKEVTSGAEITRTNADQTGDIVLTLFYLGCNVEKRFPAIVKAFTEEDAEAENTVLREVQDALTFDVIKEINVDAENVKSNLKKVEAAVKGESGIEFQEASKYHHIGANIIWKSSNPNVITDGLEVYPQFEETDVTLTATLTSPRFKNYAGVQTFEKTFSIKVVKSDKVVFLNNFATNIANDYAAKDVGFWKETETDWWNIVAFQAYKRAFPESQSEISKEAKQAYVNKTIYNLTQLKDQASTDANTYVATILSMNALGYDPTRLWTINRAKINTVTGLKQISVEEAKQGYYNTIAPYVVLSLSQGNYDASNVIEENIAYMLEMLDDESTWAWGVDGPAMLLQGLIPYYDREDVKIAVDKNLIKISEKQGENGSFGGVGSDAMVIIALAQLGINPYTDTRFIKNNQSVVDGLLNYKTEDLKGFIFDGKYNLYATKQGFMALVAAKQVMDLHKPFNVYDFSAGEKTEIYATEAGGGEEKPSEPIGEKEIKVYFTLKSDSGTWISKTPVTVKSDATVYHVFTKVLDDKGFTYEGASRGYVSSITNKSGTTLEEFSKGPNSGWLYKVNEELPLISLTKYDLSEGDSIVYYYTKDWTKDEKAVEAAGGKNNIGIIEETEKGSAIGKTEVEASIDKNNHATAAISTEEISKAIDTIIKAAEKKKNLRKEVQIIVKTDRKAVSIETKLPKTSLLELKKHVDMLTVQTPIADLNLSKENLSHITRNINGDLKLTVAKVDYAQLETISKAEKAEFEKEIGNRPILDFHMSVGDKIISDFKEEIQVSMPYEASASEDLNSLIIYYINDHGQLEIIKDCQYDENKKTITFLTNHFSNYAVGYKKIVFKDAEKHWAKNPITFLAAREVVSGKGVNTFAPNDNITRAEFAQILYGMENPKNIDAAKAAETFKDVKATDWYAKAVAWAYDNEVVKGQKDIDGKMNFAPNAKITRQDMAVMIQNYQSKVIKRELAVVKKEIVFTDQQKIAAYAKTAVSQLQKSGIINGKTATTFNPKDNATRAESAVIISALIKNNIE